MKIRNFYLSAKIDGRKTLLAGGPANKTGGFQLNITQRQEKKIVRACYISAVECDEKLKLQIYDNRGIKIWEFKTER